MNSESSPVCDFSRSFIRWRHDTTKKPMLTASQPPPTTLNNVRMPLDCLATLTTKGRSVEYGLGASCKTEQVLVERDVWMEPNADMLAVSSADEFMVIKQWDKVDKGVMLHPPSLGPQPVRQCIDPVEAFETHSLDIRRRAAWRLDGIEAILEAFSGDGEVVCRTIYHHDGVDVTLEYPVKTVNFSERHNYYQVDTGPVLALSKPTGEALIERLHLAYVAHLGGDWAEFLINVPTALEGHDVSVHHFSETQRVKAQHSLWAVEHD